MTDTHAAYGGPHISRTRSTEIHDLAVKIIKQKPDATHRARGLALMRAVEDKHPDLRIDVYTYFMTNAANNHNYHVKHGHDDIKVVRKKRADAQKQVHQMAKEYMAKALGNILDMECPNGKAVRDNTGTYVAKMGGSLTKLGKFVGNRIVGDVVSDKTVQRFMS